jgi:hypothetical protein
MHLLEVIIMSNSINELSMLLLHSSAVNICQWLIDSECLPPTGCIEGIYERYLLVYFFQFAFTGTTFTFRITAAMNIAVH